MNAYNVGIDPDSDRHGIAVYLNGTLAQLHNLQLLEIRELLLNMLNEGCVVAHIEDTTAINTRFEKKGVKNEKAATAIDRSIGKVQQAQVEVERLLVSVGIRYTKQRISSAWKDPKSGKKQFELITGWNGRSNEDTRSAAYICFIGMGNAIAMGRSAMKSWNG